MQRTHCTVHTWNNYSPLNITTVDISITHSMSKAMSPALK